MNNAVVEIRQTPVTVATGRMAVADVIAHVASVQEIMQAVMKKDVHFGIIPGTDKPTLYKQGAEVLCLAFRISPRYEVADMSTADAIRYRVTCTGTHQTTGVELGSGMGEASTGEEKYKWRRAVCKEEFDATPENLRRKKYGKAKGGGFYTQEQVRTEPSDIANTVLKMASKRAHMAMVLTVTAASDCFSQDLEDLDETLREHLAANGEPQPSTELRDTWLARLNAAKTLEQVGAIWREGLAACNAVKDKPSYEALKARTLERRAELAPKTDAPVITFAVIADKMHAASKAKDIDKLNEAGDLIGEIQDPAQRADLAAMFEACKADIEGAVL